jgi:hypothetical protein
VLRWPTAAGAVVSGASAFVAAESGESLQRRVSRVRASTTNFDLLNTHVVWGDRARLFCVLFMVLTLAALWFVRPPEESPRGHALEVLVGALVVLAAVAAVVTVVVAGHAGSQVVWHDLA